MIKKMMHIISNFIFTILLVILAISFYSWFQINVLNKSYSSFLGYSIFEVITGSMSGTIEINDYIVVKETDDINLMDVITFKDQDSIVTHRVVQIVGDKIITRGDANNSNDISITKDKIIGKVIFTIPNGAIWKKVFTNKKVLILILLTIFFFTFYFSLEPKDGIKKEEVKVERKEEKIIEEVKEIKHEIKPSKPKKKYNNHYPGKREYYKNKKRKNQHETK